MFIKEWLDLYGSLAAHLSCEGNFPAPAICNLIDVKEQELVARQ